MLFNSIQFLIFFPLVTLVYFIIPNRIKWIWLLISSYYFYMCWNPRYAILMAISTGITYTSGMLIGRSNKLSDKDKALRQKKLWVALSFTSNLLILFTFKYLGFTIQNINTILQHFNLEVIDKGFDLLLPVGISFYTFQALSYTMDVYREEIEPETNLARYALFVSFFPQLVAGPIERSKNLLVQLREVHKFDYDRVKNGLLLMIWGLFQKLVLADRLALLVNQVFNNYEQYSGLEIVIATIFFSIQIYCDFAGYSDVATGAAQVLGFKLMKNFDKPYFATSIKDFWSRWHISLSSWFKDYLYIPLGGNRKGQLRKYINIMIVFLISGLWHGASWNFVIWGGLHGLYQVIGECTIGFRNKIKCFLRIRTDNFSYRLFQQFITFSLVALTWIFFRADGARNALGILKNMYIGIRQFSIFNCRLLDMGLDKYDLIISILAILLLFIVDIFRDDGTIRKWISEQNLVFRWTCYYLILFALIIFGIYGPLYDASQFIYFQF